MTGLKLLARTRLPSDSKLRMLIEAERDEVPFSEWLAKMELYCRLLDEETRLASPAVR
jgi:hypothetical protein